MLSERTELLKKAVLTGVGATTSIDRIKLALSEAFEELAKVGQDLIEDLESEGKGKTASVEKFIRSIQSEAAKRGSNLSKQARDRVSDEWGLATREDIEALHDRIRSLERSIGVQESSKKRHKHDGDG